MDETLISENNLKKYKRNLLKIDSCNQLFFAKFNEDNELLFDLFDLFNFLQINDFFKDLLIKKSVKVSIFDKLDFSLFKELFNGNLNLKTNFAFTNYEFNYWFNNYKQVDEINKSEWLKELFLITENKYFEIINKIKKIIIKAKSSNNLFGEKKIIIGFPYAEGLFESENNLAAYRAPLLLWSINISIKKNSELIFSLNDDVKTNKLLLTRIFDELNLHNVKLNSSFNVQDKAFFLKLINYFESGQIYFDYINNEKREKINLEFFDLFQFEKILTKGEFEKNEQLIYQKLIRNEITNNLLPYATLGIHYVTNTSLYYEYDLLINETNFNFINEFISDSKHNKKSNEHFLLQNFNNDQNVIVNNSLLQNVLILNPPGTNKLETIKNILVNNLKFKQKGLIINDNLTTLINIYNNIGFLKKFSIIISQDAKVHKHFYNSLETMFSLIENSFKPNHDLISAPNINLNNIYKFANIFNNEEGHKILNLLDKYHKQDNDYHLIYQEYINKPLYNLEESYFLTKIKKIIELNKKEIYFQDLLSNNETFKKVEPFLDQIVLFKDYDELKKILYYAIEKEKIKNDNFDKIKKHKFSKFLKKSNDFIEQFIDEIKLLDFNQINFLKDYFKNFAQENKKIKKTKDYQLFIEELETTNFSVVSIIEKFNLYQISKFFEKNNVVKDHTQINWIIQFVKRYHNFYLEITKELEINLFSLIKDKINKDEKLRYDIFALKDDMKNNLKPIFLFRKYFKLFRILFPIIFTTLNSISVAFPLIKRSYDFAIFDQSEKIILERIIPIFYRIKRKIILGDDNQTNLMSLFQNASNISKEIKSDIDLISLYDFAKQYLAPNILKYNYSHSFAELVMFSNQAFYKNELIVSSLPKYSGLPIENIKVNGLFEKNINYEEAKVLYKLLVNILETRLNKESIGIITFTKEQKKYIEDILINSNNELIVNELNRKKSDLEVNLYVKTFDELENDERDIIIYSFVFGKNKSNKVINHFKEFKNKSLVLNIAITRATKKIYFIKSLNSEEIVSTDYTVKLLSNYLKYIEFLQTRSLNNLDVIYLFNQINLNYNKEKNKLSLLQEKFEQSIFNFLIENLDENKYEIHTYLEQAKINITFSIFDKEEQNYLVGIICHNFNLLDSDLFLRNYQNQIYLLNKGWHIWNLPLFNWFFKPQKYHQQELINFLDHNIKKTN